MGAGRGESRRAQTRGVSTGVRATAEPTQPTNRYNDEREKRIKKWGKNGQWRRDDGPAYISYDHSGHIREEEYCVDE